MSGGMRRLAVVAKMEWGPGWAEFRAAKAAARLLDKCSWESEQVAGL